MQNDVIQTTWAPHYTSLEGGVINMKKYNRLSFRSRVDSVHNHQREGGRGRLLWKIIIDSVLGAESFPTITINGEGGRRQKFNLI